MRHVLLSGRSTYLNFCVFAIDYIFYMYCVKVTQIFIERVNILFCGCWEALCRSYMSPVVKIKINKCDGYGSGIAPMLDDHYHGVILILNILQYYK